MNANTYQDYLLEENNILRKKNNYLDIEIRRRNIFLENENIDTKERVCVLEKETAELKQEIIILKTHINKLQSRNIINFYLSCIRDIEDINAKNKKLIHKINSPLCDLLEDIIDDRNENAHVINKRKDDENMRSKKSRYILELFRNMTPDIKKMFIIKYSEYYDETVVLDFLHTFIVFLENEYGYITITQEEINKYDILFM
jgi:hypothetical protein